MEWVKKRIPSSKMQEECWEQNWLSKSRKINQKRMNVKRTFQTLKTDFHSFCFNVKFVCSLFIAVELEPDSSFSKSRSMDYWDSWWWRWQNEVRSHNLPHHGRLKWLQTEVTGQGRVRPASTQELLGGAGLLVCRKQWY